MENQEGPSHQQRGTIDRLADEFEAAFRAGQPIVIERLVADNSDLRPYLLKELISIEIELRRSTGEQPGENEYRKRFPGNDSLVGAIFLPATEMANTMDQPLDTDVEKDEHPVPQRLGRYVIQRLLGKGGFGVVYLANDPQLDRLVALKVPRRERFTTTDQVASFIQEARSAAKLKHPGLVTVYDVQEEEKLPYIVQEYIDGESLAVWAAKHQPSFEQIVKVFMGIAEALGYAHQQGLTHCDLKLANVLMDQQSLPHVADFGLAVHESVRSAHKGSRFGTPPMMAPEQVRGEGHRLDGRTDIWALGVMLYELLVNQKPFTANTLDELFNEIETLDPRPPRQIDRHIPRDLERICLQCLQKRRTERYNTTDDLREDLQAWLTQSASTEIPQSSKVVSKDSASAIPVPDSSNSPQPKIIPKGLRSFDAEDAGFFLDLLPGPRDRDGLPGSIRFWKNRIEENDADKTFAVGLIYGPSGCGKSSLVKAGLIPRLSDVVLPIYVEATAADTEVRILKQLHKRMPRLSTKLSLPEACAELRKTGAGRHRKLLIVIDQFEQWLHAHPELKQTQLVDALRQCEGGQLQTILLVRDDFFASVHRLFQELEYPLIEGSNYALVDRFDKQHSRKVLTALGRAYDKFDDKLSDVQEQFVLQAVDQLAEDEKVVSVRLALFADMMKSRPWTLASLSEIGGASGVGVTFLDETFSAKTAPPSHRVHEKAIRQVLKALLPESGTDIKGGMQSASSLCEAAGYQNEPSSFAEVVRILDQERIITPTEPDGESRTIVPNRLEAQNTSALISPMVRNRSEEPIDLSEPSKQSGRLFYSGTTQFYQLTHDYLVPSLREWLTRKQKETRKGRAELKLAERSALWNAKPENRYLPSLTEWLSIRTLTDSKHWTGPQRALMNRAGWLHTLRSGMVAASLLAFVSVGIFVRGQVLLQQEATRIEGLVGRLISAEPAQVPEIVKELDVNKKVAAGYLSPLVSSDPKTASERRSQLHARLAQVSRDESLVEPLVNEVLTNNVAYVGPIRQQLRPYATKLTEKFWGILRDEKTDSNQRFRAALMLADYVPQSDTNSWTERDLRFVAEQLVSYNSEFQPQIRELLRPISTRLLGDLERIFTDSTSTENQRLSAANAFADYAVKDALKLVQLLAVATPEQYAILYPLVVAAKDASTNESLIRMVRETPVEELPQADRISLGKRRAGAAITLLRQGEREPIFDVLRFGTDPESLSQFVAGSKIRGVTAKELLECIDKVDISRQALKGADRKTEDQVLYGLLLALGDYPLEQIPVEIRSNHLERLVRWYATDPSSTIHGASGWLLRRWNFIDEAMQVDQTPIEYDPSGLREWFTLEINSKKNDSANKSELSNSSIYFTFIVFPAGEYVIGSPEEESNRSSNETLHRVKLTRPIAVSDRELSWHQYDPYDDGHTHTALEKQLKRKLGASDPSIGINWYESITYCRWLTTQSKIAEEMQCYDDPSKLSKDDSGNPKYANIYLNRSGFRLPTESEWEVVCRSGTQTAYSFGNDSQLLGGYGWFQSTSQEWSHSVGLLRPGPNGLFDIHGNLFEWCHDWFGVSDLDDMKGDPIGPDKGLDRVRRGGSWFWGAGACRSAERNWSFPQVHVYNYGLRIVLSPSVKSPEAESKQENK